MAVVHFQRLTPWLTGAGARSAEGTDMGHENAEGMAHVGVRVEPPVRPQFASAGHMEELSDQKRSGELSAGYDQMLWTTHARLEGV